MNDIPILDFVSLLSTGLCAGFMFGSGVEERRWLRRLKDANLKLTKGQKPKDKIEPIEEMK